MKPICCNASHLNMSDLTNVLYEILSATCLPLAACLHAACAPHLEVFMLKQHYPSAILLALSRKESWSRERCRDACELSTGLAEARPSCSALKMCVSDHLMLHRLFGGLAM